MKITNPTIKALLQHYKEISLLGKIKAILDWDLNVNLPSIKEIRKLIRRTGQKLFFKKLHKTILGVVDQKIIEA